MTSPAFRARPPRAALLAGIPLALFAGLGVVAHHALSGTALDHRVLAAMIADRSPTLTGWALAITTLFSPVGTAVLAVATAAMLWWRLGSPRPALLVAATLAGAGAASTVTKLVVGAHRPPAATQLISETDHSFPSGHVTGTVALLGAIAVVLGSHTGRAVRAAWVAAVTVTAVVVGLTRLYLGVHWVSDVLGGLLLDAVAVALAHLAALRVMKPVRDGSHADCAPADGVTTTAA